MLFVESTVFHRRVAQFLDDDEYKALQNHLLNWPTVGNVIRSTGGLRKLRWSDSSRGKGKRGGCRVIYLLHGTSERIDFIAIYGKDEQDDLSTEQRRQLSKLADTLKREVSKQLNRGTGSRWK